MDYIMSKQSLSRENSSTVCSFFGLFSIVRSGPRHDELSSKSSLFERHEMELTFESKESDFLNRFIRNKHFRKAWSSQHVSNQSGRHYAPIQPLAALLAMAKIFSTWAVEPPVSRAGPASIRSGEDGFRSLEFYTYPENLTLSWNRMPAERFHAILDLAAPPRTHFAPCSAGWIQGSARH
jgi:hypothetical protein